MNNTIPKIGTYWPGQGGIYAGVSRGCDGRPDQHLVLALELPASNLAWAAACEWATKVEADGHADFHLPTRFESALLYANVQDHIDTGPSYWTSTQYSEGYAWFQLFYGGSQYHGGKSYEARARAVRRFTLED